MTSIPLARPAIPFSMHGALLPACAAVAVTALADVLFYQHAPGVSVAIFAAALCVHLADNAVHHRAGTLRIRAVRAAGMIEVAVTNDGEPIADNNRDKIFLPFFTTRRESGGTGMGLEIVRSILRAHRGAIRLAEADEGVAFLLTFRAA
jgi:K+-sensing histidine kinase KdpD